MKLESVDLLALVHPFVEGFDQVSYCASDDETRLAARGETTPAITERRAEDIEGIEGARAVFSTIFYIGLGLKAKQRA
jgi:poly(A) polymerase